MTRSRRGRRVVAVIAGVLLLPCIALLVAHYSMPREYFAKAVVKPRSIEFTNDISSYPNYSKDPLFVSAHLQTLQSDEVLNSVVERLDLPSKWFASAAELDSAHVKLRRMLDLRAAPEPGMIHIGVYSTNAQEAADIANTGDRDTHDVQLATEPKVEVTTESTRNDYAVAKARYHQQKGMFINANARLATERLSGGSMFDPVTVWEIASPAQKPAPFKPRRIWRRMIE